MLYHYNEKTRQLEPLRWNMFDLKHTFNLGPYNIQHCVRHFAGQNPGWALGEVGKALEVLERDPVQYVIAGSTVLPQKFNNTPNDLDIFLVKHPGIVFPWYRGETTPSGPYGRQLPWSQYISVNWSQLTETIQGFTMSVAPKESLLNKMVLQIKPTRRFHRTNQGHYIQSRNSSNGSTVFAKIEVSTVPSEFPKAYIYLRKKGFLEKRPRKSHDRLWERAYRICSQK